MPKRPPRFKAPGFRPKRPTLSQKLRDRERGTSAQRGYGARWRRLAASYLKRVPLCERCAVLGESRPAREVHHVESVRDNPGRRYDVSNLVALCSACHRAVEAGAELLADPNRHGPRDYSF